MVNFCGIYVSCRYRRDLILTYTAPQIVYQIRNNLNWLLNVAECIPSRKLIVGGLILHNIYLPNKHTIS